MTVRRRDLFLFAVLAGAVAVTVVAAITRRSPEPPTSSESVSDDAPSVILVIVDTLRADRLGCYGYSRPTSPHLDALAAESVLFENAYSQAPNTPPSVASILTSLYPHDHGFTGKDDRLSDRALTLAESFSAAGYRTAAFVDGGFLRRTFGLDQGFEIYRDEGGGFEKLLPEASRWIRDTARAPYFLMLHSYDVHTPYEKTPEPYRSRFLSTPYDGTFESKDLEKIRTREIRRTLTPEETRHFSDLYDGGIAHADALLGDFVAVLREHGDLDHTILVVTADHGEEFMEHGSVLHEKLYRTVTHVPLLARFPSGVHGGLRIDAIVETIDIAPTLLAATGVPAHAGMQGRSILPLVRGEPFPSPRAVGQLPWNPQASGYYREDFHMIADPRSGTVELYDVVSDPLEHDDIAGKRAGIVETMQSDLDVRIREAALRAYLARMRSGRVRRLDPATEASLRALGYVD